MIRAFLFSYSVLAAMSGPSFAGVPCGGSIACPVKGGDYRIELPKGGDVRGAYVFFHGYKSSAELQMQQRPLVDTTISHHLAFVAVDGTDGSWSFPNSVRPGRDEKAFIADVLEDLRKRYGFTAEKTIIGGFSIGASMAWYTACQQGEKAAAMLTFSGVFWDPLPEAQDCVADLPPMIHFHGTADQTFPLEGRSLRGRFHQGNAFDSVAILRSRARCDIEHAKTITLDDIKCNDVPGCIRGDSIMCIHNGGHEARADMLDAGLTAVGFPR
ncbi:poly(3-hydroxybutyrate) depolymerase (plasmid) [Rhizobium sp. WSM4643]|uniref:alpha/beta hydrolase family esterase n=1 Tax=Rhizobium sp. WSM4643 TaxID=3138253 RepID=UPI0021A45C61|nr:poly(3-hydroxybutyrate) depolymerase [Rhizobium leguminosarum]UWM78867.1 poly(3-hydroxybutyrate) depolymerase [Rhizobium leguminosarum bv. viciae]